MAGAAAPSIAAQRQVRIATARAVQAPAQDGGTAPSGGRRRCCARWCTALRVRSRALLHSRASSQVEGESRGQTVEGKYYSIVTRCQCSTTLAARPAEEDAHAAAQPLPPRGLCAAAPRSLRCRSTPPRRRRKMHQPPPRWRGGSGGGAIGGAGGPISLLDLASKSAASFASRPAASRRPPRRLRPALRPLRPLPPQLPLPCPRRPPRRASPR